VSNKRVMIIDPSLYSRMVLSDMLTTHGYSVCCETGSGKDALANYEKARPDLVLVDAKTADRDAIAVIMDLVSKFPGCQTLFCAGSGQRSQICAAMSAGAVDFLAKPYSERGVINTLRKIGVRERTI